jgi:hypothetical protein
MYNCNYLHLRELKIFEIQSFTSSPGFYRSFLFSLSVYRIQKPVTRLIETGISALTRMRASYANSALL